MSKRFIVTLLLIAAVLGGIFWFARDKAAAPSANQKQASPTNHVQGEGKKGVELVEYGDFQCPACGSYYPILKQIKQDYMQDIRFQFRHFPITQIHPNAMAGHRAAEAAGLQNKFWEMHDMLYERQQTWSNSSNPSKIFEDYARELSLNVDKYKQDVGSSAVNDSINSDKKLGDKVPVTATPTFVLDGKKLEQNPESLEAFKKLIDDAIAKAGPQ